MKFLLPNQFKKIGAIIAPTGFALWLCMQWGYVTQMLTFIFGEGSGTQAIPPYRAVNFIVAVISFFSFLTGIYFVTFSKERIEDEMIQKTRLDSFQFAALTQIIFIIIGFLSMLLFGDPGESGTMLFFIATVSLFWLSFIGRFNYVLHVKLK